MPAETLTREQIVRAAIELLDDEGLEGLNMRALGKRLGSVPAAVYWHVKNKRDLIGLAGDYVCGQLALPEVKSADWRLAAAKMAKDFYAILIRHPWLLQVFGSYVVYGHGRARHDDHNLAIFEAAGFRGPSALLAATTLATFVVGSALGFAGKAALQRMQRRRGRDADALIRNSLAKMSEVAAQYPHLRQFLQGAGQAGDDASMDAFEFGLKAVLDGLEAQLQ